MTGQRVWKLIKALGRRAGLPELHSHAFRHGCGVELHRRTGGNLRLVQETRRDRHDHSEAFEHAPPPHHLEPGRPPRHTRTGAGQRQKANEL